ASAAGAPVSYAIPTAQDSVDGSRPVNCAPASGQIFPHGTTTVTCSAGDSAHNQSSARFTVTVNDAPPTAGAGGPYQVAEGGAVTLNGSGTDIEGTQLSYAWDLDN